MSHIIDTPATRQQIADNLAFLNSELFKSVQLSGIFNDSKTFADAEAKIAFKEIYQAFSIERNKADFNLRQFVLHYFTLPAEAEIASQFANPQLSKQISALWQVLQKAADNKAANSLLPLPHSYIIPGGRFREIYYWDSYFTALGLIADQQNDIATAMLENFIALQQEFGLIPNGNRSYYLTRSQPPILALLVDLIFSSPLPAERASTKTRLEKSGDFFKQAVQAVENEYNFWMDGVEQLTPEHSTTRRVVLMADGSVLNRYWDDSATPRPESYREDRELSSRLSEDERAEFYRNIRAACESGWDFSSRWLADKDDLLTIQTTQIIPVDLNCLLYQLESKLAEFYLSLNLPAQSQRYQLAANKRKLAINKYLWSESLGFYFDFNISQQQQTSVYSMATSLALFSNLASTAQSQAIAGKIEQNFLQQGGLVTTLSTSRQQWDSPNGWAPVHWFAVKGLMNYQQDDLAIIVMQRWLNTVENFYKSQGKLMEKYNVCQQRDIAEGGEYDVQEGFGWTNGVSQIFYQLLKKNKE